MLPTQVAPKQQQKQKRAQLLDKQVWRVYNQLQKSVDDLDHKVEISMKKHQSQFLYAYRTHIHKIRRQLEDMKHKSEQQDRIFTSNDRIRFLEKENTLFRGEALKLYANLQKKSIQLQICKQKAAQSSIISRKLQFQNKQIMLQNMKYKSTQIELERQIKRLNQQNNELKNKLQEAEEKRFIQRRRREYMDSARQNSIKSLIKSRDQSPRQHKTYTSQLQQWFLQCVKSVKRQIQQRKNNFQSIDLNKINSINDFRLVDKLKLFQMILENQKLLNFLYHKIFPDRLDKINLYLSQGQKNIHAKDTDINSDAPKSSRYGQIQQNLQLPKVPAKKTSLRNQIVIKNGRMNISIS